MVYFLEQNVKGQIRRSGEEKMRAWIKKEIVLVIASAAAIITMFLVPPSGAYLSYIDWRVLALLGCLMLVVAGLKKAGCFDAVSAALLKRAGNARTLALLLSGACCFLSMLITNDVALITLVPLALMLLGDKPAALIFTVVDMTVAANLGSMFTPIGNPQNLYLYSTFELSAGDFFGTMLFPTALSALAVVLIAFFVKKEPVETPQNESRLSWKKVLPWALLFCVALLCVARVLDYRIMLGITVIAVLLLDRKLFGEVDFNLLFTFVAFFIFVGNIKAIPAVSNLLERLVAGREVLSGLLLSQVISNVPAAVLLAGFTDSWRGLLVGCNVGGLGTPIASMASLISYKLYAASKGAKAGKYMKIFLIVNFAALILLGGISLLVYGN